MKGAAILTSLILVVSVSSPAATESLRPGQSLNRPKALARLKGCGQSLHSEGCNEDSAAYLIGLYEHGDKALLGPLLDAGLRSDGALSEMLGRFYGELLSTSPRTFLKALSSRPQKEQRHLAWLAAAMDGSGMTKEMLRDVRFKLQRIFAQNQRGLSSVAKLCLSEVNKVNGSEQ